MKEQEEQELSERLKYIRTTIAKKSLKGIEADTGINDSHYSLMERGKRKVTDRTIKVLSSVYGVDENWLRTGAGPVLTERPNDGGEDVDDFERLLLAKFRRLPEGLKKAALKFCDSLLEE